MSQDWHNENKLDANDGDVGFTFLICQLFVCLKISITENVLKRKSMHTVFNT